MYGPIVHEGYVGCNWSSLEVKNIQHKWPFNRLLFNHIYRLNLMSLTIKNITMMPVRGGKLRVWRQTVVVVRMHRV